MIFIKIVQFFTKLFSKDDMALNYKQIKNIYGSIVDRQAALQNISPNIIFGIIKRESDGDHTAVGLDSEVGLMQVTPIALREYNNRTGNNVTSVEMFDPEKSILIGTWFFSWTKNTSGFNIFKSLQAYNAGISNIKKDDSISFAYADSVIKHSHLFEKV